MQAMIAISTEEAIILYFVYVATTLFFEWLRARTIANNEKKKQVP